MVVTEYNNMTFFKMIEGANFFLKPIFNSYGLRDSYLGYGGGLHSVKFWIKEDNFEFNISPMSQLKHLAYVHGSFNDLLEGKVCVIRNSLSTYEEFRLQENTNINVGEKNAYTLEIGTPVYKLAERQFKSINVENGKTLIFIGKTMNGNSKIVLK